MLNNGELTLSKIDKVAADFQASLLCTTCRGVRLSDLPCVVAGLREGRIAWMFPSKPLIAAKCYPGKKDIESPIAKARWAAFRTAMTNGTRGWQCSTTGSRHSTEVRSCIVSK